MDLRTAMNNLRIIYPRFPREELECIRAHKEEAILRLLNRLRLVLEKDYAGDIEYVLFPLAEFRVREALPLLLELLRWDEASLEQLMDFSLLFDDFGSVLASCAVAEDIPALKEIALNDTLSESARYAALRALMIFFVDGEMTRDDIVALHRQLLEGLDREDPLIESAAFNCCDLHLDELTDVVKGLFDDGVFDVEEGEIPMDTWEGWQRTITETSREEALEIFKSHRWGRRVDDCIESMSWWDVFQNGAEYDFGQKIWVNDPCPCGSGRKFKKCCMLRVRQ